MANLNSGDVLTGPSGTERAVRVRFDPSRAAGSGAALYLVLALFLANLVSYADRSILALLVEPIKKSLGLTDGQIGLAQGPAFVVTFTIAGLFMGQLVDRASRRRLLVICIAIWSVSAACSGLARNFGELFVARMGVGVGEAAMIPAAISLISDAFGPNRRGSAYGFFMSGAYVGSGLVLIVGALALPALATFAAQLAADGRGTYEPWRLVLLALIVPGLICCVLLSFMREPARAIVVRSADLPNDASGGWREQWRLLLPHHLCSSLVATAIYAVNAWFPTLLIRQYGFAPKAAGLQFGPVVVIVGIFGAYIGGYLADRASARAGIRGRTMLALGLVLLGLIGFLLILSQPTVPVLLTGVALIIGALGMSQIATVLIISDLTPSHRRGRVSAIYFVFAGVIGTAGGPALVGFVSDALGGGVAVSQALAYTGVAATIGAIAAGSLFYRLVGARGARQI